MPLEMKPRPQACYTEWARVRSARSRRRADREPPGWTIASLCLEAEAGRNARRRGLRALGSIEIFARRHPRELTDERQREIGMRAHHLLEPVSRNGEHRDGLDRHRSRR